MSDTFILEKLNLLADPEKVAGMVRFGINTEKALGVPIPCLRSLAKEIGSNHQLALKLWGSQIHEARLLASMIDQPELVTEEQMDYWVRDFNSWDICDQVCSNLFDKTKIAFKKAEEWSQSPEEFIKRAGFALMACLAVHDKTTADEIFVKKFFPLIKKEVNDQRNFVKKAVNWALRQIGKRNKKLNKEAIKLAREIKKIDSKTAQWIASDALRELRGLAVQERFKK